MTRRTTRYMVNTNTSFNTEKLKERMAMRSGREEENSRHVKIRQTSVMRGTGEKKGDIGMTRTVHTYTLREACVHCIMQTEKLIA